MFQASNQFLKFIQQPELTEEQKVFVGSYISDNVGTDGDGLYASVQHNANERLLGYLQRMIAFSVDTSRSIILGDNGKVKVLYHAKVVIEFDLTDPIDMSVLLQEIKTFNSVIDVYCLSSYSLPVETVSERLEIFRQQLEDIQSSSYQMDQVMPVMNTGVNRLECMLLTSVPFSNLVDNKGMFCFDVPHCRIKCHSYSEVIFAQSPVLLD
ncbi:hypothetical protein [Photobacterium leiognathi]|uniref:hypothetical protein n=1 Tax=Photobacterium leiognathi TaxID=553611 RepID=UPI0029813801|nr:hypothetical protein [Photobacterium leiognathi]